MDKKPLTVEYDDSKEIEMIYDFHGTHILHVNTTNANTFLEGGRKFDAEMVKRLDEKGRSRVIYVADRLPPLSALLKFMENPVPEIKWGVYAVVLPKEKTLAQKFMPIMVYGIGITNLKNKYTIKLFEHEHKYDFTEIFRWMDQNMTPRSEGAVEIGDAAK